jgi:hypothetical protein
MHVKMLLERPVMLGIRASTSHQHVCKHNNDGCEHDSSDLIGEFFADLGL